MGKAERLARECGRTMEESIGAHLRIAAPAPTPAALPDRLQGVAKAPGVLTVPLAKITPDPNQPRKQFDPEALERLAANLKERGQLQPIRVRWDGRLSRYLIVAGERRYRAAILAAMETLVCVVDDRALASEEVILDQIAENCAREDLAPMELASSLLALTTGHGLTTRQVAESTGLSQASVSRALALAGLPGEVQTLVASGAIPAATAYAISRLSGEAEQIELARRVNRDRLTRAQVETEVRNRLDPKQPDLIHRESDPASNPTPPVIHRESPETERTEAVADSAGVPAVIHGESVPAPPVIHGQSPEAAPEPVRFLPRDTTLDPAPGAIGGQSPPERPAYVVEEFSFVVKGSIVQVNGAQNGPGCIKALEGALYQARRKYGPGSGFPPGTRVEVADPTSGDQGRRGEVEGVSPHNYEILHVWLDLPDGVGGREFASFDPDQLRRVDQA